ncbi:MAG: hypothetical protein K2X38_17940 [Gemmataceae bacterium]|nr:hypothetical protein [Gemmataceae bacterium]
MTDVLSLPTVDALRRCVHMLLCDRDQLDPDQTPLKTSLIVRRGKTCGLFFQVDGPRLLKNYAVWAGDENRILLYDASGERYGEIRLSEAPDPRDIAA